MIDLSFHFFENADMRMDPTYISVYITWMYLIFIYTVPFGGLCVLNTQMFLDVR